MQRLHAAAARAMSPAAGVTNRMSHNLMSHYNHMSNNHLSHVTLQSHVTRHAITWGGEGGAGGGGEGSGGGGAHAAVAGVTCDV